MDHDHNVSDKDLALLKYMLEHNKQHARELSDAGVRLAGAGLSGSAELIAEAVCHFEYANDKLEKAVGLVESAASETKEVK